MHDGRGDPLGRRAAELLRRDTPDERAIERVIAAVRTDAAVRTRVAASQAPRTTPAAAPRRPQRVPVWAAIAAAVATFAVGLVAGGRLASRDGAPAPTSTSAVPTPSLVASRAAAQTVEFLLVAPNAKRVSLVGEFNGWDAGATPMRRTSDRGTWEVSVPLPQGRHVYSFIVDDSTWVTDPQAPLAPERWYGERNSVVVVAAGGRT